MSARMFYKPYVTRLFLVTQKDWGRFHTVVKPTCCPDPTLLSQPPKVHDLSLFGTEVAPPPTDSVGWQETLTALQKMRESQNSTPVGGRLQKFWPMWKSIGATQKVVIGFEKVTDYHLSAQRDRCLQTDYYDTTPQNI